MHGHEGNLSVASSSVVVFCQPAVFKLGRDSFLFLKPTQHPPRCLMYTAITLRQ